MQGLMQKQGLLISGLIDYASAYHGDREIVSRSIEKPDGPLHRTTWRALSLDAKRLANVLTKDFNIKPGDRVATLCWNSWRHLQLYYGVSCIGAVFHTVNPRLFPEQIEWIINHAEDLLLFADITFAPIIDQIRPKLKTVKQIIYTTDAAHLPKSTAGALAYDSLLARHKPEFTWPVFDENLASSLCYTSGTTGNPKGVVYSHRSTLIHTLASLSNDSLGMCSSDCALVIVPLFHANGWGIPYSAAAAGAKLVFPGANADGKVIYDLILGEQVTYTCGVPTIWMMFFEYVDKAFGENVKLKTTLNRVSVGGSAPPRAMIKRLMEQLDVTVLHGWGMTEMSPLGTVSRLLPKHLNLPVEKKIDIITKQGRPPFGVEITIVDDDLKELPHDGKTFGDLLTRGPWITSGYYREGKPNTVRDNWFPTGDVATIDKDGYMQITDRSKDVIKTGGEWISSIDVENEAHAHPAVGEACVVSVPHSKWQERPLLLVVVKPGKSVTKEELLQFLSTRMIKWWLPDDIIFVKELPHTATGKLLKHALRKQYANYILPTDPLHESNKNARPRSKL